MVIIVKIVICVKRNFSNFFGQRQKKEGTTKIQKSKNVCFEVMVDGAPFEKIATKLEQWRIWQNCKILKINNEKCSF